MSEDKKYSDELERVMKYINDELIPEFPTYRITVEYLMLGILEECNSNAYKIIEELVLVNNIETTIIFLTRHISTKALTQPNINKKVVLDDSLKNIIDEVSSLYNNSTTINSEHIVLQILKSNTKMKRSLSSLGVDYNKFEELVGNDISDKKEQNVQPTKKATYFEKNNFKQSKTPNIDKFCVNLTNEYNKGLLTELIGREDELKQIIQVLNQRDKNNVVLVGESGVGKTTIINGLIKKINELSISPQFFNKIVINLDINSLMAGLSFKGMAEERIKQINEELNRSKSYILVIDDINTYASDRNNTEVITMIDAFLRNNNVKVIILCDLKDYKLLIESNSALIKNINKILIEPTSINDTIDIITTNKKTFEKYYNVKLNKDIIKNSVILADKYLTDKSLPQSAISFIDMVCSKVNLDSYDDKPLYDIQNELNKIKNKKKIANDNENYETVDFFTIKETKKLKELNDIIEDINKSTKNTTITVNHLYDVISSLTKIPINKLDDNLSNLKNIDKILKSKVIGQDKAIDKICAGIKRKQVGLGNTQKPISFMCIGQSGVGKTLLAKTIAKELLGSESSLIRFDMSEFSERHSISKLIGSPPGYVGYDEGGTLTEAVKHKKYCVLLLDEIEKACPEVFNVFLQLLDDGFLTDSSGKRFDFSNVIILLTSNVGTRKSMEFSKTLGFNSKSTNTNDIIDKEFKKMFAPEFINRLTDILIFENLKEDDMKKIIILKLEDLNEQLEKNKYGITWNDDVVDYIYNNLENEKGYGARPINRFVETNIETIIIDSIINKSLKEKVFNIEVKDGILLIK